MWWVTFLFFLKDTALVATERRRDATLYKLLTPLPRLLLLTS